MVLRISFISLV